MACEVCGKPVEEGGGIHQACYTLTHPKLSDAALSLLTNLIHAGPVIPAFTVQGQPVGELVEAGYLESSARDPGIEPCWTWTADGQTYRMWARKTRRT